MVESQSSVQLPRVVYPLTKQELDSRRPRQIPTTSTTDDGKSKEHKDDGMSQKTYWEDQHKHIKTDNEVAALSEQKEFQQNYLKSTPEEKINLKFFKELPIETYVDEEAINEAKQMGLTQPDLLTGRMSNELV